jgi:hypothetical protein
MEGWMDGWIDGWMDGWIDGWMDGWMGENNEDKAGTGSGGTTDPPDRQTHWDSGQVRPKGNVYIGHFYPHQITDVLQTAHRRYSGPRPTCHPMSAREPLSGSKPAGA